MQAITKAAIHPMKGPAEEEVQQPDRPAVRLPAGSRHGPGQQVAQCQHGEDPGERHLHPVRPSVGQDGGVRLHVVDRPMACYRRQSQWPGCAPSSGSRPSSAIPRSRSTSLLASFVHPPQAEGRGPGRSPSNSRPSERSASRTGRPMEESARGHDRCQMHGPAGCTARTATTGTPGGHHRRSSPPTEPTGIMPMSAHFAKGSKAASAPTLLTMNAPSSGGKSPRESVEHECASRGTDKVVVGCIELLEGRDVDAALVLALGGPPARWVVTGEPSGPSYWLRVWALRGLLWAWDDMAFASVEAALHDDAWRVREMALKVVARHRLEEHVDDGRRPAGRPGGPRPCGRFASPDAACHERRVTQRTGIVTPSPWAGAPTSPELSLRPPKRQSPSAVGGDPAVVGADRTARPRRTGRAVEHAMLSVHVQGAPLGRGGRMGWHMGWYAAGHEAPSYAADSPPELADVRRLGRRVLRTFVTAARADDRPRFSSLVAQHLGQDTSELEIVEETWPTYDHVNVQAGLDAWLAEPGREHELVGMVNFRHHDFTFADLLQPGMMHGPRPGNVARVNHATGPDGAALACVRCGVYLVRQEADRVAILVRGGRAALGPERGQPPARLRPATCRDGGRGGDPRRRARQQRAPWAGALLRCRHVRRPRLAAEVPPPPQHVRRPADPARGGVRRHRASGGRGRPAPRPAPRRRPAPQARTAPVRPAGGRQDPHRPLPGRCAAGDHDHRAERRRAGDDQRGLLDRTVAAAGDDRGGGRRPDRRGA